MMLSRCLAACLALLLLSACASTPKVAKDADRAPPPTQAAAADGAMLNRRLQWGGVIVSSENLTDTTELQILAYPLEADGRPDVAAPPIGRFIAQYPGYLESVDYATGRQVTVTGKLTGNRLGEVGKAPYTFPVLLTEELVLWPQERGSKAKPKVNFGFGVGSGGRSWGGIGIGIGF